VSATLVNVSGALVPEPEARISVLDQGLLYGRGLFETLRAARSRLFRAPAHLERLRRGAETLGIFIPWSDAQLQHAMLRTLAANTQGHGMVRLTVTAGIAGSPLGAPVEGSQSYVVTVRPRENRLGAASAITASYPVFSADPLRRVKSLNYGLNCLAREAARARGADEALLLNERREVVEAAAANLFIFRDGALRTPPVKSGCLPGVTRAVVLEIADARGLLVLEEPFRVEDLLAAEDAFLTNSGIGVRALGEVDGRAIGSGRHAVAEQLAGWYEEIVRSETSR
jgi:branched-chain amino acid aminotransferase